MKSLGAIDSNFYSSDTETTRQVIGLACGLDKKPEESELLSSLNATVNQFPRLRKRITGAWKPSLIETADFRIENQLIFKTTSKHTSFEDALAEHFSTPFTDDLPPWRFIVFQYHPKQNSTKFGAALFVHHAIADGLGVLRIFMNIACDRKSFPKVPAAKLFTPTTGEKSRVPAVLRSIKRLIKEYITPPKTNSLNGKNSNTRQIITHRIEMDKFYKFARDGNGSINDLYLACVAKTVSRYHHYQDIPLGEMRAIMPVNLRNSNDTKLGNHLTGVGVNLPAQSNDLEKNISTIRQTIRNLKESGGIGAYYLLAQTTAKLPGQLQRYFCEVAAKRTSFICTNVPGPTKSQYLGGAKVTQYYGLPALMRDHGVAFCLFSSEKTAFFSIVLDPQIVRNKELLLDCLKETLDEISQADNILRKAPQGK